MRRPGFTLIELLVAAALFISLTSLAAYWIMVGVRAQEFERNAREAQVTARDVLNRLVDEMRTATTLPLASREEHPVPSGVLYPDPYGSTDSPFGGIYRQGVNAVDGHYAENRVIFTRAGTDTSGGPSTRPTWPSTSTSSGWRPPIRTPPGAARPGIGSTARCMASTRAAVSGIPSTCRRTGASSPTSSPVATMFGDRRRMTGWWVA